MGKIFVVLMTILVYMTKFLVKGTSFIVDSRIEVGLVLNGTLTNNHLQTTLKSYAVSMLLSSKVTAYKGTALTNALVVRPPPHPLRALIFAQTMVMRVPGLAILTNILSCPADFNILFTAAGETLTQAWSTLKKAVCALFCPLSTAL
jgi:hypothetical protein